MARSTMRISALANWPPRVISLCLLTVVSWSAIALPCLPPNVTIASLG